MKKIAILLILLTSLHCRKEDSLPTAMRQIEGSWELRKLDGGIAGTLDFPPGNGTKIEFHGNEYSRSSFYGTYETGTYLLFRSSTAGQWQLQLKNLSNSSTVVINVRLTSSSLVLLASNVCCDEPNLTYAKL